jgi:methylenetetrahydrofolate--tRNA-(uracil-5-)-methyltransferase
VTNSDKNSSDRKNYMTEHVLIIGGGLAGSEAAWQLAKRGIHVKLYEMRPKKMTGAHVSNRLAELVCSNSLGSKLPDRATGLLQTELKLMGSMLIECAEISAVAAGGALAVDRELFSSLVTEKIESHPNIDVIREEITEIPDRPCIIASGPLTSEALTANIGSITGETHLYFYDAISPIVVAETINMDVAFVESRYGRGDNNEGDYINCPMTEDEYRTFIAAIRGAEKAPLRNFEYEDPQFFEGCLPIEQMVERGENTLAYGPMRPIGLRDPRTGKRPFAVVQLRRDNLAGTLYNIVGFQTNIKWGDQENILRLIPGLEQSEFVRMGQMHRNTFINSPSLLQPTMQFHGRETLYFAGQITGVEGYAGNIATGLLAGINASCQINQQSQWILPKTSMIGALCHYVTHAEPKHFQPMKANFGILPPLDIPIKNKTDRNLALVERALTDLKDFIQGADDRHPVEPNGMMS